MLEAHAKRDARPMRRYIWWIASSRRYQCPSFRDKRVSPHVLRHTCALNTLQATRDLRKVSLWLGHASTQTTDIYLQADPTEKLEALAAMKHPALRPGKFRPPDRLLALLRAPGLHDCPGRMRSVILAAQVGTALLTVAGCHLIFPFNASSPDGPGDDLRVTDAAERTDQGIDRGPIDDALHDLATGEAPPNDATPQTPDLPANDANLTPDAPLSPDAGCNEPPLVTPSAYCNKQGTACSGTSPADSDCDGMIKPVDPVPTGCNLLRFADDFGQPPGARWTPGTSHTWSCGKLHPVQGITVNLATAESAKLGSLPLVNVAFQTPATLPGFAQSYEITVRLLAGTESNTCYIKKGSGTNQIYLGSRANGINGSYVTTSFDGGWPHVLQMDHSVGLLRCRLHRLKDNSQSLSSNPKFAKQPVTALQITFNGIDVELDYVHAFKHPP
jgi:Phage integrase family